MYTKQKVHETVVEALSAYVKDKALTGCPISDKSLLGAVFLTDLDMIDCVMELETSFHLDPEEACLDTCATVAELTERVHRLQH